MLKFFETNKNRNQPLDVLRFAAILLVLGRHSPRMDEGCSSLFCDISSIWRRGGWIGVDLFFVLSGFLVSGLLFKEYERKISLSIGRFYVRRGLKIYPAFYFFLTTTSIAWMFASQSPITKQTLVGEIFFLQNYLDGIWWHTWSLAVEEHFYILLPIVLFFLLKYGQTTKDPFRPIIKITIAVCALLLVLRILNSSLRQEFSYLTHIKPTHLRLDSLIVGVAISYYYHFRRSAFEKFVRGRELILCCLGLCLLIPAFVFKLEDHSFIYTLGFSLIYIGSACLLCASIFSTTLDLPIFRIFGYIGSHSYSIYLWHIAVIEWGVQVIIKRLFGTWINYPVKVFLAVILCFGFGIFMAKLVEFPFLKLRDRFFPSKTKPPVDSFLSDSVNHLNEQG